MAGKEKSGDGLSKLNKNNASAPKESDNIVGISSESMTPTGEDGEQKIIDTKSLGKNECGEDGCQEGFDLMRESLVVKAVDRFLEENADEISDGEETPRIFSQGYEARKKKMLQTAFDRNEIESITKPKRRFRIPAAAAAAVIFLAVAVGLGAVRADAMPEPIRILVMQVQSLFSSASVDEEILYGENQATDFPEEIKTVYEPSVVLDGYEVSERILQSKLLRIYYADADQNEYSFQQITMDFWVGYNTENVRYEEVEVNGYKGIIYIQNGQKHLQWQQDGYVFEFIGNQTLERFKKLAASVKRMED
ncbi:DUF4367 domain-containing protein [Frisingicoccus sp.]|uniref:DUF4367 domain-containing protein n=1 Tax=Frisingicoccus sp. TaxID=1918627 RepID=UPI003AB11195